MDQPYCTIQHPALWSFCENSSIPASTCKQPIYAAKRPYTLPQRARHGNRFMRLMVRRSSGQYHSRRRLISWSIERQKILNCSSLPDPGWMQSMPTERPRFNGSMTGSKRCHSIEESWAHRDVPIALGHAIQVLFRVRPPKPTTRTGAAAKSAALKVGPWDLVADEEQLRMRCKR